MGNQWDAPARFDHLSWFALILPFALPFALLLAVKSPELQVLGSTITFGDTETRARIGDRFVGQIGHSDIQVLVGEKTSAKNSMSQGRYADGGYFARAF